MQTLAEQFQEYLKEKKLNVNNHYELLNHLREIKSGFVMTYKQFESLVMKTFLPKTLETQGTWSIQFHPKSGHMFERAGLFCPKKVYHLPALSRNFELFRWSVGITTCKQWCEFYKHVANKCRPEYIVLGKNEKGEYTLSCLELVNSKDDVSVTSSMHVHIGGGRIYNDESARPYQPDETDEIIDC